MKYCLRWIILFHVAKGRGGDPTGFRSGPYAHGCYGQYTMRAASSLGIERKFVWNKSTSPAIP